jgi:hypothetical protein
VKLDKGLAWMTAGLLGVSALLYVVLFTSFGRLGDIEFYTVLDLAFIPINVLIVSLVLQRVLVVREKAILLNKLNMVIGAFFSEVGTDLLQRLASFDTAIEETREHLQFDSSWKAKDFAAARGQIAAHDHSLEFERGDVDALKESLVSHRQFLLRLLENQNLLEHESFTEALWAVFHLTEELDARRDLMDLAPMDLKHVEVDAMRAYEALLSEWLGYLRHLKAQYPFLYSFAVRTNPFDANARVSVET